MCLTKEKKKKNSVSKVFFKNIKSCINLSNGQMDKVKCKFKIKHPRHAPEAHPLSLTFNRQRVPLFCQAHPSFQMASEQIPGGIYLPKGPYTVFVNAFYVWQAVKGMGWDQ